jgi:hypothetical protein
MRLSSACYISHFPVHLIPLDFTTLTLYGVIVEKPPRNSAGFCGGGQGLSWDVEPRKEEHYMVRRTHYEAPQYTFFSLTGPNLLSTLFSNNILNMRASFSVRDQVSNPYKAARPVTAFHILIFTFSERRPGRQNDSELNGNRHTASNLMRS